MIRLLAISVFLQTNVLCASIKQSLVSFDNNLRSLNNKIIVDEKQQKIEQLLEMDSIIQKIFTAIGSSDEIDDWLKKDFIRILLAQLVSVIKANDPQLRKNTLSDLNTLFTENIELREITQPLIPATYSELTPQEIKLLFDRLTFLMLVSENRAVLENIYKNIDGDYKQNILTFSRYIFETRAKSARDPETDNLITFMKNSGNERLQKIAADCEHLWAISVNTWNME